MSKIRNGSHLYNSPINTEVLTAMMTKPAKTKKTETPETPPVQLTYAFGSWRVLTAEPSRFRVKNHETLEAAAVDAFETSFSTLFVQLDARNWVDAGRLLVSSG